MSTNGIAHSSRSQSAARSAAITKIHYQNLVAWIDTGFDGHLVFSTSLIDQLGLESLVETEAILADGSKVALETFVGFLDWFGERIPVQVIANEGKFPLLGTELLAKRTLSISYGTKELRLD